MKGLMLLLFIMAFTAATTGQCSVTKEFGSIIPPTLLLSKRHTLIPTLKHWLTQYNKREVQYKAGHKYISSTEQYVLQEMGSLTDQLAKYHPFG